MTLSEMEEYWMDLVSKYQKGRKEYNKYQEKLTSVQQDGGRKFNKEFARNNGVRVENFYLCSKGAMMLDDIFTVIDVKESYEYIDTLFLMGNIKNATK